MMVVSSTRDLLEGSLNFGLGLQVYGRSRIVQQQYLRIHGERTGNGNPLFLTTRKVGSTLFYYIVIIIRFSLNEFMGLSHLSHLYGLFFGKAGFAKGDIFKN